MMRTSRTPRLAAAMLAVLLGSVGCATAAPTTPSSPAPAVPRLDWAACPPDSPPAQAGFQCATATVPLDYATPTGPTIDLAVVRHAATGPGDRIGTLFLNPGGPGGSGFAQIPSWFGQLPKGMNERFDVVSWDPRGIGQSTAVQCFDSADAEAEFLGVSANFPATPADEQAYIDTWRGFGEKCAARAGTLLDHTSTALTARDLDLLRQAVGDDKLNYLGLSYGTFLGATYLNMFPDKVRSAILDGNVAPSAWTADGDRDPDLDISSRIGSPVGAATTMNALLQLCGAAPVTHCAFSAGSPEATSAKFDQLVARLQQGPIQLPGRAVEYTDLLTQIGNGLDISIPFDSVVDGGGSTGWAGMMATLQKVWEARDAAVTPPATGDGNSGAPAGPYSGAEGFLTVGCKDAPSPPAERYSEISAQLLREHGPMTLSTLWGVEPCATWPSTPSETYAGPWDAATAPVLVLGPTVDPSTPFANSTKMADELGNARLLTVEGYGHTVFLNASGCAAAAELAYLVDGTLPPEGTICRQDTVPFSTPTAS